MRRLGHGLLLALLLLAAALGAFAPTALASACAGRTPRDLRLTRLSGPHARLSWKAPKSAADGLSYRVQRSGRTVGQTVHGSLVLRVTPGRLVTFSVQARASSGGGCAATLRSKVAFHGPGPVARVRMLKQGSGKATIAWSPAKPGDAPLAGYRVERNSAVVGETHAHSYTLKISAARAQRVSVAAVDTRGHLGPASKALVIGGAGGPSSTAVGDAPSAPSGVGAAEVSEQGATVFWVASKPASARIVGYRVYRDGTLVGQTAAGSMRLVHLTFPHTYAITVTAIDANKHESARSAPLSLSTAHTPPNGSPLISAEHVTDTSATLSWQPGSANGGATLAGYLLFKDGTAVGVIHGQSATVALASQREYSFTVRALDSLGSLSAPAPNVTVVTTHTPPPAPAGLSASDVTSQSAHLAWSPSAAVSGEIVGYRVFRDGIPVGQTATPEMTLSSLAPSSDYEITVVAVDSLGAISEPTPVLAVHTAEPTPTTGTAQAFLLASTDQSFDDLQAHYQQLGVVYPTYYECGAGAEVTGKDDPLITGWAQARRIEVMPRLNCQNTGRENQILNNTATRTAFIENLANLARAYDYQGIQIDFEGAEPSERAPFTAFITALAERLHSEGRKLSTIVTAKYYNVMTGRAAMYDDASLAAVSDYIFVLDWGIHWTTSAPGSIDEYAWFKRVAEYTATMPDLSKFVLGMPMYGIDWANGGGLGNPGVPLEYEDIVALQSVFGGLPEWDATALSPHFSYTDGSGVHHQVWYTDKQSIGERTALAASLGLKVGLWHLGSEDQSVWELPQLAPGA
jgi:spore germination protein YaaH